MPTLNDKFWVWYFFFPILFFSFAQVTGGVNFIFNNFWSTMNFWLVTLAMFHLLGLQGESHGTKRRI